MHDEFDSEDQNRGDSSVGLPLASDAAALSRFMENQRNEIEAKRAEIQFKNERDARQHDFACRSLEAQKEDRKNQRAHEAVMFNRVFVALGVILVLSLGFLIGLVALGHADLVKEIIKVLGAFILGGFGGYGLKQKKTDKEKAD